MSSRTEKEKIPVVMAPDQNYAALAGVAVLSILQRTPEPKRFHFYFLQGDNPLTAESRAKLAELIQPFGATIEYVTVNAESLKRFENITHSYLSLATLYRMLTPDLLPFLDRCLYLDCDIVALGNVAELWDVTVFDTSLAAAKDCFVDRQESKRFPEVKTYFNAGVLLLNLHRWRERNLVEKCLRIPINPQIHLSLDQDVLNIVFCDDISLLHPRWNSQTGQRLLTKRFGEVDHEWAEILESPRIAHFTTDRKPPSMHMAHPWAMEYWRVFAQTPWARETPDLKEKLRQARWHRCKSIFKTTARWLFEISKNSKTGEFRFAMFGRILIDFRPQKSN